MIKRFFNQDKRVFNKSENGALARIKQFDALDALDVVSTDTLDRWYEQMFQQDKAGLLLLRTAQPHISTTQHA